MKVCAVPCHKRVIVKVGGGDPGYDVDAFLSLPFQLLFFNKFIYF